MYVHDKLELPVPAELEHHFEMIKVRVTHKPHCCMCRLPIFAMPCNLLLQSIRHLCHTLCEIPTTKNAAPLLNYACRTGNNELLVFGLKMGGNLSQVFACFHV